MKLRELSAWSIVALALSTVGVALGAAAMLNSDPFLGLFSISVVCAGAVSALVGLQNN